MSMEDATKGGNSGYIGQSRKSIGQLCLEVSRVEARREQGGRWVWRVLGLGIRSVRNIVRFMYYFSLCTLLSIPGLETISEQAYHHLRSDRKRDIDSREPEARS